MNNSKCEDLRDLLRLKAEKHSLFYRTYIPATASSSSSEDNREILLLANNSPTNLTHHNKSQLGSASTNENQNQKLDYEFNNLNINKEDRSEEDALPCGPQHYKIAADATEKPDICQELIEMNAMKSSSFDDGCYVVDNVNEHTSKLSANCRSSIDALDRIIDKDLLINNGCMHNHSKHSTINHNNNNNKRRMTLTVTDIPLRPALLPLAEPTSLPICESPTSRSYPSNLNNLTLSVDTNDSFNAVNQSATVRSSKMILEEQVIPIPSWNDVAAQQKLNNKDATNSNRHGQNCDENEIVVRNNSIPTTVQIKFVRTPSVVVSDYSDDVIYGITLEEIEYLRSKSNYRRCSFDDAYSDVSASSSCSNLNYCCESIGNSYDNLFDELATPERKISNGSQTSTISNEDVLINGLEELKPQPKKKPSGWRKLRNIVQWTPFFQTYKKQRYPWIQLAGHQGNFKAGPDQGTVLKKLCSKEEICFHHLMQDVMKPYVPEYKGQISSDDGEPYIQLQDLLSDFVQPCVMDCKIGVRTYLEEELSKAKEKPKLRKDMYEKMIQIDSEAPTEEEHRAKGVTKPRYMVWRETISSTATLGFRIEGIKKADGTSSKDFKTTKSRDQILAAFKDFSNGFENAVPKYIERLKAIRDTLRSSDFFKYHEVIGSSLLFVHDKTHACVWLIDFAKTVRLPEHVAIDHHTEWTVGNHEDGYLIGLNNIIELFEMLQFEYEAVSSNSSAGSDIDVDKIENIIINDDNNNGSGNYSSDKLNDTTLSISSPEQ